MRDADRREVRDPRRRNAVRAVREILLNAASRDPMSYQDVAFDIDTRRYLELNELAESIAAEMAAIKERFRALGQGTHEAPNGVAVTVTPPNRSFNLPKATTMLSTEQLALCTREGYDPKKVRMFLAPALMELCMEPGSGELRVTVK